MFAGAGTLGDDPGVVPVEREPRQYDPLVCFANETTTTTLDDLTHASLVQPVIIRALTEKPGCWRGAREFNIIDQATNAAKLPTETSYWGSANDDGVGVDTEFDATQATSLGNTAYSSGQVTCTAAEYGVAHALIDNVVEDSVRGIDVMDLLKGRMLFVLALAWEDDFLAQYANLSQTVGTSGVDLTIAQMIAAQQGLRTRGVDADAMQYTLDNQQAADIEAALLATNAAAAIYALSADRLIGYAPTPDNGMGTSRQVMTFRGLPVIASGLTDTANAGADVVGACYCPSTAHNDESGATTYAIAHKRLPRFETQRQAKLRGTDLVMTNRLGFAEIQDGAGTAIITDA